MHLAVFDRQSVSSEQRENGNVNTPLAFVIIFVKKWVTSAALEGYFSQASLLLNEKRNRLNAENIESELIMRVNASFM